MVIGILIVYYTVPKATGICLSFIIFLAFIVLQFFVRKSLLFRIFDYDKDKVDSNIKKSWNAIIVYRKRMISSQVRQIVGVL
jgi:hypothetical protein